MRAKKTWLVTCGVLAGVCIAGTFGWTRAERQYQEDLAALRSMGVPTTAEELRELSRGPGENAADDYRKALEIWLTIPSGDRNRLMGWRQDMSEERQKAADRNEATLAQLCERLSLAASKEHANWETPWEQGHESLLEARRASWFINFLGGHVKDQIAAGEVDHALDSYLAALRISNHICEVRSEHFYSTSGWTGSNLSDSLELLLEAIQDDPQRLRKLLVGLEALPETPAPEYAMISNYVVTLYALRQVPEFHKLKGTVNGEPAPNNLLDRILDTGLGRRTLERALARDARTFWEELPRGAKNWREQAKAHRDHLVEVASAKHNSIGGYALATIQGNPSSGYELAYANAVTVRRLSIATVKLLLDRAEGRSLAFLATSSGDRDLYTGAPFGFVIAETDLVLYSFGSDGKDDGGTTKRGPKQQTTDIAIRVKLTPLPNKTQVQVQ